jgi:hypothetical protein
VIWERNNTLNRQKLILVGLGQKIWFLENGHETDTFGLKAGFLKTGWSKHDLSKA